MTRSPRIVSRIFPRLVFQGDVVPERADGADRVIQGLWVGRALGFLQRLSVESFLHFGHAYHLYCYEDVANVPAGVTRRDANEILPESAIFRYPRGFGCGSVAAFSNLFRYKLLLERGGWWVDTDVLCLRPWQFSEPVVLAAEDAPRAAPNVANAVMRLPRGHEIARACYEAAECQDRRTLVWGQTGPQLLTRVVKETSGAGAWVKKPEVFCPVPYWHWESLLWPHPDFCTAQVTPATHAVHLWHEVWRHFGLAQGAKFPDSSFMGQMTHGFGTCGRRDGSRSQQAA